MKKTKRILALIGAILLFGMYACTLIFALSGSENSTNLLMASIACTIFVPVILYAYQLLYKVLKGKGSDETSKQDSSSQDD